MELLLNCPSISTTPTPKLHFHNLFPFNSKKSNRVDFYTSIRQRKSKSAVTVMVVNTDSEAAVVEKQTNKERRRFEVLSGKPLPFGATATDGGVNFAVFSSNATSVILCLITLSDLHQKRVTEQIFLDPLANKTGDVWHVFLKGDFENMLYGYMFDGKFSPEEGHYFDFSKIVLDPYAKATVSRGEYGVLGPEDDCWPPMAGRVPSAADQFDWEGDLPLKFPQRDLVIYEMHVRGFTNHESSKTKYPGTYRGVVEKLDHLKELGVNCIELMPCHEFNELEYYSYNSVLGEYKFNFWGYSTVNFFSPMGRYSSAGLSNCGLGAVNEFKYLVKEAHKHGIEVIMDVVFNHTAEGNENGPIVSFRGIDNSVFYMLAPKGEFYNYSGCGNTFNCNHLIVRQFIVDCLRWNPVIEKCEKKLSRWKSQYISLGGRVTLINSVLDALPTYMLSVFPIPVGVIERLDKIRRDFLWKGDQDKKVFHLVKWANVLLGKKQGGLGIRNLKLQSKALRLKWLWRYSHTPQPYWGRMIKAKYGEENKWMTKEVHTSYGVGLWRSIRALWPFLWNHSTIKVSNGHKTSFWEDKWLGNTSLKELFPVIHGLAVNQHKKVAEIWDNHGWNLQFRRNFNDWEINTLTELFRLLEEFKGTQEGADKLWWKEDSKGIYKVSTAYKFLNQSNQQVQLWPWKHIWKVKVPFKVACFTWLLAREAVLTQENLKKRKFSLCSRCYLCGEEGETVNHLFLHCRITIQLWRIFVNLRGIVWVMPNRITNLLHIWEEAGIGASDRDRWRIVPACIWWTIWKERNSRCFEDSSSDVQKIKLNCVKLFCFWCKQIYLEETESIIEILGSC